MQAENSAQEPIWVFFIKGNMKIKGEAVSLKLVPVIGLSWVSGEPVKESVVVDIKGRNDKKMSFMIAEDAYFVDRSQRKVSGIFVSQNQKNEQTYSLLNEGKIISRWTCTNLIVPFKSLMLNWGNMLFQVEEGPLTGPKGEDIRSQDKQLEAVMNKTMPSCKIHLDSVAKVKPFLSLKKGLVMRMLIPDDITVGQKDMDFDLIICQEGPIGEMFDLDAWIASYEHYSVVTNISLLTGKDKQFLRGLSEKSLLDCFDVLDTYNHRVGTALHGLIVGVPLELTFSMMSK